MNKASTVGYQWSERLVASWFRRRVYFVDVSDWLTERYEVIPDVKWETCWRCHQAFDARQCRPLGVVELYSTHPALNAKTRRSPHLFEEGFWRSALCMKCVRRCVPKAWIVSWSAWTQIGGPILHFQEDVRKGLDAWTNWKIDHGKTEYLYFADLLKLSACARVRIIQTYLDEVEGWVVLDAGNHYRKCQKT